MDAAQTAKNRDKQERLGVLKMCLRDKFKIFAIKLYNYFDHLDKKKKEVQYVTLIQF